MCQYSRLDIDELLEGVRKVEELIQYRDAQLEMSEPDMQQRSFSASTNEHQGNDGPEPDSGPEWREERWAGDFEPDFACEWDGGDEDMRRDSRIEDQFGFEWQDKENHDSVLSFAKTSSGNRRHSSQEIDKHSADWWEQELKRQEMNDQKEAWQEEHAYDFESKRQHQAWDDERVDEYNFGPRNRQRASNGEQSLWSRESPPPYSPPRSPPRRPRSSCSFKISKSKSAIRAKEYEQQLRWFAGRRPLGRR